MSLPAYTVVDGETVWNPDLFRDHSLAIALHESAHAAMNYLTGRESTFATVGHRRGRVHVEASPDAVDEALGFLAGPAFDHSLGLDHGSPSDIDKARAVLRADGLDGAELEELMRRTAETALEIVGSEQFQTLAHALAPELAKRYVMGRSEIHAFLEAHDPTRASERHSAAPTRRRTPWYEVTLHGELIYRGPSHSEAKAVQARHPRSVLVGSEWAA